MSDNRSLHRDGPGSSDQVEARLVIRLLGEVAVSLDGYPPPDLITLRLQRLLGRLGLASKVGLRRDRLAYQLWPDSTEPQARTNLRKLFHDLRRSLPDANKFLDVGGQTIRWHAWGHMWGEGRACRTDALSRAEFGIRRSCAARPAALLEGRLRS